MNLLYEHGLDVGSKVSLFVSFFSVGDEEAVKKFDQVFFFLLLVAFLDIHQILNATSVVFQDAINQQQGIGNQRGFTLHLLHDFK